jgi:hypothetical protein
MLQYSEGKDVASLEILTPEPPHNPTNIIARRHPYQDERHRIALQEGDMDNRMSISRSGN